MRRCMRGNHEHPPPPTDILKSHFQDCAAGARLLEYIGMECLFFEAACIRQVRLAPGRRVPNETPAQYASTLPKNVIERDGLPRARYSSDIVKVSNIEMFKNNAKNIFAHKSSIRHMKHASFTGHTPNLTNF